MSIFCITISSWFYQTKWRLLPVENASKRLNGNWEDWSFYPCLYKSSFKRIMRSVKTFLFFSFLAVVLAKSLPTIMDLKIPGMTHIIKWSVWSFHPNSARGSIPGQYKNDAHREDVPHFIGLVKIWLNLIN